MNNPAERTAHQGAARRKGGPSCQLCDGLAERFYTTPSATELLLLCGACDEFIAISDEEGLIQRLLKLDGLRTTETEGVTPITLKQKKREIAEVMAQCKKSHTD